MKQPRWTVVSPSAYEWECEALEFLREHLPDYEPWRAWSNLEFVDDEGRVNEVDLLVLSPLGLMLVEVKSRPGTIDGDAHSWVWTTDGRRSAREGTDLPQWKVDRPSATRQSSGAEPSRPGEFHPKPLTGSDLRPQIWAASLKHANRLAANIL